MGLPLPGDKPKKLMHFYPLIFRHHTNTRFILATFKTIPKNDLIPSHWSQCLVGKSNHWQLVNSLGHGKKQSEWIKKVTWKKNIFVEREMEGKIFYQYDLSVNKIYPMIRMNNMVCLRRSCLLFLCTRDRFGLSKRQKSRAASHKDLPNN